MTIPRDGLRPGRPTETWRSSDLYRVVPETVVVQNLVMGGWVWDLPRDPAGCGTAALETLERFVAAGLPFRETPRGRAFDMVEVMNFSKSAGLDGSDPFWEHFWVETGRRNTTALAARSSDRVHVTLRRTFGLEGLAPGSPLRLRLPMPVQDAQIEAAAVEIVEDGGLACRIASDGTRIEARGPCPASPDIDVTVAYTFTCRPERVSRDDRDLDRFLEASDGLVHVTPRVRALAAHLAGSAPPREALRRFRAFMLDHLMSGTIHYDRLAEAAAPTDWVLQTGWFDCQLGGALLAALCRASGIPARMASGYYLHPQSASNHYWVEVWMADEGWLSFDLSTWDLSLAGRDPSWREHFTGTIEPRLKTELLPLHFTGRPGLPLPTRWHMLQRWTEHGTESSLHATDTGALLYRDRVTVRFADPAG